MVSTPSLSRNRLALGLISGALCLWASLFIFRTSVVAYDGHRYFSLFDDAMISMRYAWNATHGLGLVWNPGEPVEGYSNLLMVGVMAVWTAILDKTNAVLAVQISGIPVLLGIAALAYLTWLELARGGEVARAHTFGAFAFAGCLLYYPLAYWTLMGMETGLLTLLVLAGSLLSLRYARTLQPGHLRAAAVLFGMAYLTRADSAPASIMILGIVAYQAHLRGAMDRTAWVSLGMFTLFPIAQSVFRLAYYGSLVPNTYTLKLTGMSLLARLENGFGFTSIFLRQSALALILSLLGAGLSLSRRTVLLVVPPATLIGYQILIGGDGWPYWRLLSPAVPFLILLTLLALDRLPLHLANRIALCQRPSAWKGTPLLTSLSQGWSSIRFWRGATILSGLSLIFAGVFADLFGHGSAGFGYAQRELVVLGLLSIFAGTALAEQPIRNLLGFLVLVVVIGRMDRPFRMEATLYELPYKVTGHRDHINAALAINQLTNEEATVGVTWAGIIPYYTSRYSVDFLGKNDPYIASLTADTTGSVAWSGMYSVPGHNKYDLEYSILTRRPTYIEGWSWGAEDLSPVIGTYYVEVSWPGPDPAFLRGDPSVRWDLISPERLLDP